MKNLLLTITMLAIIGLSNFVNAQTPDWAWAKSGEGSDEERAFSVATDALGNVIVAGFFKSPTIDFGATTLTNNNSGTSDIFLVKYDVTGNVLWAKSEGDIDNDVANSVTVDASGNIIVTGVFYSPTVTFGTTTLINAGISDMFIVKYDSSGTVLWAKSEGSSEYEEAWFVTTDASENLIVTGVFNSPSIIIGTTTLTNTASGYSDMFITKYDSAGNALWAQSAGGGDNDVAYSVAADALGNYIVTGSFTSATMNFASDTLTNSGSDDIFIAKYNSAGTELWAKSAGGSDYDAAYWIAADGSGNLIVTGSFFSPTINFASSTLTQVGAGDMFILKYDTAGNELWAKSAGNTDYDFASSVTTDALGNIIVAGAFTYPSITFGSTTLISAGGTDMFIVKYDPVGNALWAKSVGGVLIDIGYSAIVDALGNIIEVGYFDSPTLDFGNTTLTNANTNNYNIYVAKLHLCSTDTSVIQTGNILTANTTGATYQWLDCNNNFAIINGATNQIFTPTAIGNYAVSITINGCTDTSSCYSVIGVGLNEINSFNTFYLSPNPAKDLLVISYPSLGNKEATISILDITGKIIYTTTSSASQKTEVNTSDFAEGVYLVQVQTADFISTQKVIVAK